MDPVDWDDVLIRAEIEQRASEVGRWVYLWFYLSETMRLARDLPRSQTWTQPTESRPD